MCLPVLQLDASLNRDRPYSVKDCVRWARLQFQRLFHNDIAQLLHTFPVDKVTAVGTKFWSGPKRAPGVVVFSPDDPTQMDFIQTAATLYATVFGLHPTSDREFYRQAAIAVDVPPFTPRVRAPPSHTVGRLNGQSWCCSPCTLHHAPCTMYHAP